MALKNNNGGNMKTAKMQKQPTMNALETRRDIIFVIVPFVRKE